MNNLLKLKVIILIPALLILYSGKIKSQENLNLTPGSFTDSLSLKGVIEEIIKNHPTVKSAEEALINADARIGLAKTGYYPVIDMTANFSNQGPVIKLTIPSMGTIQLFPENSYSASVNYRQVIYDFGRTRQNLSIENGNKLLGEQTLKQVKQQMAMAAVSNFYTLAFLQEAVKIKDEELAILNAHLKYIETMKSTGSATDYQLLSTKVKISSVESQKVDLISSQTIQQSYLNSLLGNDESSTPVVKEELYVSAPVISGDSLISFAYQNRDEIAMSHEKSSLAGLRYELVKSLNKPIISFMATGGAKNGFVPNLNQVRPNYALGVGISVPLFDGRKTKFNLLQAESAINTLRYETENAKRSITSEVKEAEAYLKSAIQKINQFELQLEQALKAFALAETSFQSGMITNMELLDADTAVSESRLMLLKARIDYAASMYSLKEALGERLY
jgi:outer membrane protein TolC